MTTWTPEQDTELKKFWADGLTASQIAVEMRCGFTRNAIIGRVHRLGLSGRARKSLALAPRRDGDSGGGVLQRIKSKFASPPKPRPTRLREPTWGKASNGRAFTALDIGEALPPPPVRDDAIPIEQRCTIQTLTNETCRYPIGDPSQDGFFFSGKPEAELDRQKPYCNHHRRVCRG
jgi:GcrA cell cycle regulator